MKAKVEVFERDAATNDGYVYTTAGRLSSRLATRKLSDLILGAVSFEGEMIDEPVVARARKLLGRAAPSPGSRQAGTQPGPV